MSHSSNRKQNYAFGQQMLELRTAIGLTQAGLADRLGVSRQAIGDWETGQTSPKARHLQELIALGVEQQVFTPERVAEEIRALWRVARQKVLLDEQWLAELLGQYRPRQVQARSESAAVSATPSIWDWNDALDVPSFYGRDVERTLLFQWMVQDGCRVVNVLGMGGIGKSALTVTVMREVAPQFAVVIWRSLRDAPPCRTLVDSWLQVLAPHALLSAPDTLEARLRLLMGHLREKRVLLVLDNAEMLLEEGTGAGRMRAGFEDYTRLLQQIGETVHQSCLLLTSREKLSILVPLEGSRAPVRALRLVGLDAEAGAQLLHDKDVGSSVEDRARLVAMYSGNPLALKMVAQTIVDVFGGEIAPFLAQGEVVFGGLRELLREQFERLSPLEQAVVSWLAILREPAGLRELLAVFHMPEVPATIMDALDRLGRRSFVERGQRTGSFTLQSVVLEYVTARLVVEASTEIMSGALNLVIGFGFTYALAKEYVRRAQEQVLLVPLLHEVQRVYPTPTSLQARCFELLDQLRASPQSAQGYGPANLLALLHLLRGNLQRLDLSGLALRGVFLHGVAMQDANLSHTLLRDSILTEAFDDILAVAVSSSGAYWAAVSRRGDIRVWEDEGRTLRYVWQAYTSVIWQFLVFSPDGRRLASGSIGSGVKVWDVASGTLIWSKSLPKNTNRLSFSADGQIIVIPAWDGTLELWDYQRDTVIEELPHPGLISPQAWSPQERLMVCGSQTQDGTIWLWRWEEDGPARCVQTLAAHSHWVNGLAFAPDGTQFASASYDGTVKVWDVASGRCLETFTEHTDRVMLVEWSPDGRTLASCGFDHAIWLREMPACRSRGVLQGHAGIVTDVAFTPDSRTLISGSDDGTVKVWDADSLQCVRTIGGYVTALLDLDWSPDGTRLASGGADMVVTVWDAAGGTPARLLHGHRWMVHGVGWHPGGQVLTSAGLDNRIRVWDVATGAALHDLHDPDGLDTVFQRLAWSPDGQLLACGSYGRGVQVWEMASFVRRWIGQIQATLVHCVAWSPDGTRLAGGDSDGVIYLWDARDGSELLQVVGHSGAVMSLAWRLDGQLLASGAAGGVGGELFVWDVQCGERLHSLAAHPGLVSAVAWSLHGEMLISGCSDGMLRWWELASGQCLREEQAHQGMVQALKRSPDGRQLASCGDDGVVALWELHSGERLRILRHDRPYERMDIAGLTGITEAQRASLLALGAVDYTHQRVPPSTTRPDSTTG
jgi:WD40 repeat protein/transcriptional regulator with XRE-family HTH domain